MSAEARMISLVCSFPLKLTSSKETQKRIGNALDEAGFAVENAGAYISGSFFFSAIFAAIAFPLLLFFHPTTESIGATLILFALAMACFLYFPQALAKRRRQLSESELPFLLRELAIYIDIGLPFEKAIARIGRGSYALTPDFAACAREVAAGASVQSALSRLSAGKGSLSLKRCLLALSSLYETGGKGDSLKRMAEDLSDAELAKMRAQIGRFSLLAIAFIAASALIPSFFTVYAAVSPLLSGEKVDTLSIWLYFLIAFPLIDAAALFSMLLLLPPASRQERMEGETVENYARKKGIGSPRNALFLLAAASILLAALFFVLGMAITAVLCLCIAPAAYAFASYAAQREIADAENRLPDALYAAASTHRLFSSEKMLAFLSRGEFDRLSEAFEMALRRQKAGESFEKSMEAASKHCPSPLVRRAFSLLIVSHQTGADMRHAMRESAADVVSFLSLVRERAALLSMQRYTVLAAAALLVPAILGVVAYLAPSLISTSSLLQPQQGGAPLESLASACQFYLLINAALSSAFLALSESDLKKAVIYFALCAPLSEAVFALVSAGSGLPAI